MKILITGTTGDSMPPPYGGIPKVSLLYGRTWKNMGNEVAVTFVYRPENADDFGANAQYFFEFKSKPNKFKKLLFLVRYFIKNPYLYTSLLRSYVSIYPRITVETILYSAYGVYMDGVIHSFKPDIIHCQTALIKSFMVSKVAQKRGIPVVYNTYAEVHDQKMGVNNHLSKEGQNKYWTSFLAMPEIIIGMSNCSIGPLMYVPAEKVKVFYDTCDFSMSRTELKETKNELRKHLGLPEDAFIIGAIGAFEFRKGHDQLIKASAQMIRNGLNVAVAICGAGDKTKWQELAEEENIKDNVFFFSRLPELDLIKLHRSLDAYCNLSNSPRSCGLDLALLEAMASGLPIVVCDNGALPTAVKEGENGYVVKTDNIEEIKDAFLKLYNLSSEERKGMGHVSQELAQKCDINLTAKIKIGWFEEVIKNYRK